MGFPGLRTSLDMIKRSYWSPTANSLICRFKYLGRSRRPILSITSHPKRILLYYCLYLLLRSFFKFSICLCLYYLSFPSNTYVCFSSNICTYFKENIVKDQRDILQNPFFISLKSINASCYWVSSGMALHLDEFNIPVFHSIWLSKRKLFQASCYKAFELCCNSKTCSKAQVIDHKKEKIH